jgi:hypothetical protein
MFNQGCASLKMLWSHTRSIDVSVFSDKVVYRIPLYSDFLFKNAKFEYCNDGHELKITTYQEPSRETKIIQQETQSRLLAPMDF